MTFVEAHGAFERFGRVERDVRTVPLRQLGLRIGEKLIRDGARLAFRQDGHSAQVPFALTNYITGEGADDLP